MKIEAIDFYKGIAIILVIMIHTSQVYNIIEPLLLISQFGDLGCQMFFTISAFCLCLGYEKRNENYIIFFKKRLKKIAPGYWLTIILSIIISFLSINLIGKNILGISLNPLDVMANFALLNGFFWQSANNHVIRGGWFVGTLVILYALFPMLHTIYKATKNSSLLLFLLCLFIVASNVMFWILLDVKEIHPKLHFENNPFFYFCFLNQMPSFMLGFYMYILYSNRKVLENKILYSFLLIISSSLLLFLKYNTISYGGLFCPFLLSLSFVYLFELTRELITSKRKIERIICNIGRHSYSIYLLNTFISWEIGIVINSLFDLPDTYVYIIWFPVSIGVLYFLGVCYERVINNFERIVFRTI